MKIEYDYDPYGPAVIRAHHFDATFCDEKGCGLHIFSRREDGSIICETILSEKTTLDVIRYCQKHLYQKATEQD
jgi:hypothetical protein